MLLFASVASQAASFDCAEATRTLDAAICENEALSRHDERMADYYYRLRETLDSEESEKLLHEQRAWLKSRTDNCRSLEPDCLVALYQQRIEELQGAQDDLISYQASIEHDLQGFSHSCSFNDQSLPEDYRVLAGGAYSGKATRYEVDPKREGGGQFDVLVNEPEEPVALLLGAYEPSVWHVSWTEDTEIVAVLATGYHKQVVAGLPEDTPLLISTYDNGGSCGHLVVKKSELDELNPMAREAFDRKVDMVYYAQKGRLVLGEKVSPNTELFTSSKHSVESLLGRPKPKPGRAGLKQLEQQGDIREVTRSDLKRWAERKAEHEAEDLPPVASGSAMDRYELKVRDGFVIRSQITIPAKLNGANATVFFLPEGVPYPEGDLGHSTLYDFNTMNCKGVRCGNR